MLDATRQIQVVIVNYNAGAWLYRSINSVLTYSNSSLTVIDNASTDNSVAQARSQLEQFDGADKRITWLLNAQNRGFAAANNQVLEHTTADYVLLMNPDCELQPDTLELLMKAFRSNPEFGLMSCRILNEDGSLQATCRRRFPTPWSALVRMLKLNKLFPSKPMFADFDYGLTINEAAEIEAVEAVSGAFMIVSRSALQQVGLLDEGYFMHCEDLDWCKRFQIAGWQVGFVPQAAVVHAKGVSSKSRPIGVLWTLHKGMNRFFDKFYRNQTAWPLRIFVKVGIYISFVLRALKRVIFRGLSK